MAAVTNGSTATYAVATTAAQSADGVKANDKQGEMNGREVTVIDINDTAAWNKYLDDEIASEQKKIGPARTKMIVAVVAAFVAVIVGVTLMVTLPIVVVKSLAALFLAGIPICALGIPLGAHFAWVAVASENKIDQYNATKKMLKERQFVQFVTEELGAKKISFDQIQKAIGFFYQLHPKEYMQAVLKEQVDAFKAELAKQA